MRKLTVRQKDGSQVECGCTFTLAGGFVYTCDAHLRVAAGIKAHNKQASSVKHDFIGPLTNGRKPGDPRPLSAAERRAFKKPATKKHSNPLGPDSPA